MKVVPKKKAVNEQFDSRDVRLAQSIINHLKDILMEDFDFIVDTAPEVSFFMSDEGMLLNTIRFEADDVDAVITVDEEDIVLILDDTQRCILYEPDGFEDIFNIDDTDLYTMDAVTKERLMDIRKLWFTME